MIRFISSLFLLLVPMLVHAQQDAASEIMRQQGYSRIQRPSRAVIDGLEEKDKEVISVGLEKRGADLVVQTQDAPLRVDNDEQFTKYAQRITYEYQLELKADDNTSVNVQAQQLTAVKRWQDSQFATKGNLTALDTAYQQLDQRGLEVAGAAATETDLKAFSDQIQVTKKELVSAYRVVDEADMQAQHQLIENFQEVHRTGKALYGTNRDDRYPPEAYQRIFDNSRGSLAILADGGEVHCSGVLVARDHVLTNKHCTDGFFPTELRVRFDYERRIDGDLLPTRTLPVTGVIPFTSLQSKGYDFAVLKIGEDGPDGNHAGDLYPVQCLSLSRVRRDDPLYLIGHPQGEPRTVHDNTFVFFPFRVTEFEFIELEMLVRSEFLGSEDEITRLQEFRDSYREHSENGVSVFENFSLRWNQQPTIGVDSDTFHGNSGSPTYNRKTHQVIGILFDGEDDLDEPWQVGWRAHEAVLPIEVVVERLDEVHPDWRHWNGVCIK